MSNNVTKYVILNKIVDYLKLKKIDYKKYGKLVMLQCIYCKKEPISANIIPNTHTVNCLNCKKRFNLIDIIRILEGKQDEEKILHYLKELLNIDVVTKIDENETEKVLNFYENNKFCLIALAKNSKIPVQGESWKAKEYRSKEDWQRWLANGCNIGIRTGEISGITVIDLDVLATSEKEAIREGKVSEEKKKELLEKRKTNLEKIYKVLNIDITKCLVQETLGGQHLIYKYDSDFPKTFVSIEDIHIDIENNGGYIVSYPSNLTAYNRHFVNLIIPPKMSEELKQLLLSKVGKREIKENGETIIKKANLELIPNHHRDVILTQLGGVFRNRFNPAQTEDILHILNANCCQPKLEYKQVSKIAHSLGQYTDSDEQKMIKEILNYLAMANEGAYKGEIELVVLNNRAKGEDKKKIDKILANLIKENQITRKKKAYHLVKKADWKTSLINAVKPLEFKIPYLNDIANCHYAEMIMIGGKTGTGKSHIAMNMIKQLVDQGIKPYLIELEPNKKFLQIALQLGIKEGDFYYDFCNPSHIELEKNSVTIIDWVLPESYAEVDKLFYSYNRQLLKTNGFLIVFVQLKEDSTWFSKNLIHFFSSVACRFLQEEDMKGEYSKFIIEKVNDPKYPYIREVPCKFDMRTKQLKRIEDLNE